MISLILDAFILESLYEVKHVFIALALSTKKRGCNVLKLLCLPVKSVGGEIVRKLPNHFSLSPHQFLPSFRERKTKIKLPTQQCHGIQFYWIRVESIQIGKKWCKMCDNSVNVVCVCLWVCVRFMLIWSHRQKMQTLRFTFTFLSYCCTLLFGGWEILSHIKILIQWNIYSSNMTICLLCTVHWLSVPLSTA